MHRFIVFANNTRAFEGLLFIAKHRFANAWFVWRTVGAQCCSAIYSRNVRINVYLAAREFCTGKIALEALTAQIPRRISIHKRGAQQNFNNVRQNPSYFREYRFERRASSGAISELSPNSMQARQASDAGFTSRFGREANSNLIDDGLGSLTRASYQRVRPKIVFATLSENALWGTRELRKKEAFIFKIRSRNNY